MKLIYYRGLNCYLASVVSVVEALGVNYKDAFSTLWSETDFTYDTVHRIFASEKVLDNFRDMGIKIEKLNCSSLIDSEKSLNIIPDKELFVVGMDTFYVPWSQMYRHFHERHYFFVQKYASSCFDCFDPVYDKEGVVIQAEAIAGHAYDLVRVTKAGENELNTSLWQEAREILRIHPKTMDILPLEIEKCVDSGNFRPFINKIDAMINNRRLFQKYLHDLPEMSSAGMGFFDQRFFSHWEAVKNGLYKASILKDNKRVADEVSGVLLKLMREEIYIAEQIIALEPVSA